MTRPVVLRLVSLLCALVAGGNLAAAVLPEDRTDVLYHYYEGDNIEIEGPAVLIRKKFGDSVSVSGNYYVDMITSASIDVVTTASPYSEDHEQWALSVDYLRGGTMMTVGYNRSEQDDHESDTVSFVVSQNLFGDLTTVTLAYALGNDIIGQSTDPTFAEDLRRHRYGVGLSQIMTRNLILTLNFEGISDEGYLNNPYRSVRYLDEGGLTYSFQGERYPRTRTSSAAAFGARYYLPYRAALHGQYRFYSDTWGIVANSYEVGYTHPWRDSLTFSARYRFYSQEQADFYSDLFPRFDFQNFLARDKELSTFTGHTVRAGVAYDFGKNGLLGPLDRGRVSLFWDRMMLSYDNFRDLRDTSALPGQERLFELDADVVQLLISFWY